MGHLKHKKCPLFLFLNLLLEISTVLSYELERSMKVSYYPQFINNLEEDSNSKVNVSLMFPKENFEKSNLEELKFDISSFRDDVATGEMVDNIFKRSDFKLDGDYYTKDTFITVKGHLLGKGALKMRLVSSNDWLDLNETKSLSVGIKSEEQLFMDMKNAMEVWVIRSSFSANLTKYFVISVVILISLANIMMGCELDLTAVAMTLRRPIAPLIGIFAQFLIMPILAYLISYSVFMPRGLYSMALGLFVTGCSPGGGASNFWTLLLDGNLNLSVTMTFISTTFSLVMMPTWFYFLGEPFVQGFASNTKIKIPYGKIVSSLFSLVIPLFIGLAIKRFRPEWAAKIRKIMRPFLIFVMIFVVGFGSLTNMYMFKLITLPALLGGLSLPWCGFMFGCFAALLTNRTPEDVTAIAIETGIQNTGIAILMLKASFAQPDADIGSLIPVIVAAFTPGPLLLGWMVHMTLKAMKKRRGNAMINAEIEPCVEAGIKPELVIKDVVEIEMKCTESGFK